MDSRSGPQHEFYDLKLKEIQSKQLDLDKKLSAKLSHMKKYMAETNELLKFHSQEISSLNDHPKSSSPDLKIKFDKLERTLSKNLKDELNSKYDKIVKEKIEVCLNQMQEFLKKYVSNTKIMNTQIKQFQTKVESLEDKVHTIKSPS